MSYNVRLSDLPLATTTDSYDYLLLQDTRNDVSKKISFGSLNNQLSLTDLSDYDFYLADIQSINDQLDLIIGDGTLVHSLSDMDELIQDLQDSIRASEHSFRGVIDTLRENVDQDILSRNQIEQSLLDKINNSEELFTHAGLSSGFLYVKEFKGG